MAIHTYVRRQQVDTEYAYCVGRDQRKLVVAVANRLELNVEQLFGADL